MLSPEMIRLLAESYEECMHDPTLLPATIHTMSLAYQEICTGEDPWTALGNFTNAWYGYAKHMRADLVREPLVRPERETEHTRRWGAFCAASVEFLCERYGVLCPEWVHEECYILPSPWSGSDVFPEITPYRSEHTQPPFVKRNIFCGGRLFQNKYELFKWIMEARAKGITDPHEIQHYAYQKERAVHGA